MDTRITGQSSYVCSGCGKEHAELPLSFAADYPDNYARLSRNDREARCIIGSDQCIIDQAQFYIRGCLEIPIQNTTQVFLWGLWASIWERDFDEISDRWQSRGRENSTGPYKGRLANSLSIYAPTANLRLTIHVQPVGQRPLFAIDDLEHPLSLEQKNGITIGKAREYACLLQRMAGP